MNVAVQKFFPGRSKLETRKFIEFIINFQNFDFQSFNELKTMQDLYQPDFNYINLTEIMLFVKLLYKFKMFKFTSIFDKFPAFMGL